ncbi:MAG: hypothetical protein WDM86_17405 [Rhizomicrobium sp.]
MQEDWREKAEREHAEYEAERAAYRKRREEFQEKLFGSPEPYDWRAPAPVENFDALLAEHAAQLRNAVRQAMGFVLADNIGAKENALAASALTRLIQANIAIAKVLGSRATAKTVHGGAEAKEPQD